MTKNNVVYFLVCFPPFLLKSIPTTSLFEQNHPVVEKAQTHNSSTSTPSASTPSTLLSSVPSTNAKVALVALALQWPTLITTQKKKHVMQTENVTSV